MSRLVSEASSALLPLPQDGDLVQFQPVDAAGEPCGAARSCVLAGDDDEARCLREARVGEVRARGRARVRLLRHEPRVRLPGGVLDVLRSSASMTRAAPGTVAFYSRDGQRLRADIGDGDELEQLALRRLRQGERARLTSAGARVLLELHFVTHWQQLDFGLRKLPLNAGGFERARLRQTVTALVDGAERSWAWGLGTQAEALELAAMHVGSGERAEIEAPGAFFVLEVLHVGAVPATQLTEEPLDEYACAVAKSCFARQQYALAAAHYRSVRGQSRARAQGNLVECMLRLGRCADALAAAREARDASARGLWRLTRAALAAGDLDEARAACARGSQLAPALFGDAQLRLRSSARADASRYAEFCRRIFA
jgi:hypothetical protein